MRGLLLLVVVLGVAGCTSSPAPEPETNSKAPSGVSQAASPDTTFDSAPVASEWLIDTKKTLHGLSPDQAVQLLGDLIQAGAADIRVTDIVADPQDASFMIARALLLEMPTSEGRRKSIIDKLEQLGMPEQDPAVAIVTLDLTRLQLQTPAPN